MNSESQTPILSLRNIKKSYGPIEVLHGIDLDVCAGEAVAAANNSVCGVGVAYDAKVGGK